MTKDKIFNVGDTVFVAGYGDYEKKVQCPVCFGKKKVTLILGDDTHIELDCDYCRRGYEGSLGWVMEAGERGRVDACVITARGEKHTAEGIEYTYISDRFFFSPSNAFATREEAQVRADELAKERKRSDCTRAAAIKDDQNKSYSRLAGCFLKKAKESRAEAERYEAKAVICKQKARKAKP